MKIDIYMKKSNKTYDTEFGIPFECVELIRRFFSIFYNISFPSVVNAIDFLTELRHYQTQKQSSS